MHEVRRLMLTVVGEASWQVWKALTRIINHSYPLTEVNYEDRTGHGTWTSRTDPHQRDRHRHLSGVLSRRARHPAAVPGVWHADGILCQRRRTAVPGRTGKPRVPQQGCALLHGDRHRCRVRAAPGPARAVVHRRAPWDRSVEDQAQATAGPEPS